MMYRKDPIQRQGLIDLCRSVKGPVRKILETGGAYGGSALIFAEEFPQAQIVTVDHWIARKGKYDASNYGILAYESFIKRTRHIPNITPFRMSVIDALPMFKPGTFDFLYIDDDHSLTSVATAIQLGLPLVTKAIGGHDYVSTFKGVSEAVHLFFEEVQTFQDGSWLKEIPW